MHMYICNWNFKLIFRKLLAYFTIDFDKCTFAWKMNSCFIIQWRTCTFAIVVLGKNLIDAVLSTQFSVYIFLIQLYSNILQIQMRQSVWYCICVFSNSNILANWHCYNGCKWVTEICKTYGGTFRISKILLAQTHTL